MVSEEYIIADICERFGWTWEEYQNQPLSFIRTIKEKLKIEQDVQREKNK